jgi:hypothetical protein
MGILKNLIEKIKNTITDEAEHVVENAQPQDNPDPFSGVSVIEQTLGTLPEKVDLDTVELPPHVQVALEAAGFENPTPQDVIGVVVDKFTEMGATSMAGFVSDGELTREEMIYAASEMGHAMSGKLDTALSVSDENLQDAQELAADNGITDEHTIQGLALMETVIEEGFKHQMQNAFERSHSSDFNSIAPNATPKDLPWAMQTPETSSGFNEPDSDLKVPGNEPSGIVHDATPLVQP